MLTRIGSRFASGVLTLVLASCGTDTGGPEAELRAWVDEVHAAAEGKDRDAIIDRISTAYADARGNRRDDISNMLRLYFLRANRVEFVPVIENIDVMAETAAEVVLTVAMAGTDHGRFALRADAYRFELELEDVDGDWQLLSARWAELGQAPR